MELLLDTNVLIGLIENRLNDAQRAALASPEIRLHTSVACLWEIAIKVRLGKLPLSVEVEDLAELVQNLALTLYRIDVPHVLARVWPELATRDPFDRLLLAQCQVEGLKLVTLDRALGAHPLAFQW